MNARLLFLPATLAAVALSVASALPAVAAPEPPGPGGVSDPVMLALTNTLGDDVFSTTDLSTALATTDPTPTQHYGPYPSGSTDSGTCADWAQDTYDRHFTVRTDSSGAITVVEQFKSGTFVTLGTSASTEASPGGCDTNVGGVVNGGVEGSLHGYFIISNVPPQMSMSPYCDAANGTNDQCTTTTFMNTHFFGVCYPATCTVTTFSFDYAAGDQGLMFHDWKNASADRGGNRGDIANT